jgi:hypothetical protein
MAAVDRLRRKEYKPVVHDWTAQAEMRGLT